MALLAVENVFLDFHIFPARRDLLSFDDHSPRATNWTFFFSSIRAGWKGAGRAPAVQTSSFIKKRLWSYVFLLLTSNLFRQ